jgi:DNA-binding SARP family transcriptional activator
MQFRVLGPLEVLADERSLDLNGPQQRAVLAVLLFEANREVSQADLVNAVWGDPPPEGAIKMLHTYVYKLRKELEPERGKGAKGEVLKGSRFGYQLCIDREQVDEVRFARLLEAARQALTAEDPARALRSIDEALLLWRGPALVDIAGLPFAVPHVRRLEGLRSAADETRLAAELGLGLHDQVVERLQGLVAEHPSRERLRQQLALALYRCGRSEEAVQVCREGLERLQEQALDSPDLQRLQQQILRQDPELAWKPPSSPVRAPSSQATSRRVLQLPPDVGDFTGRRRLTAELEELLGGERDGQATAVVVAAIIGKAGVGKTTLAVHVAHRLSDHFPDGALYINLRGTEAKPHDPSKVLISFLGALGLDRKQIPDDLDEQMGLYRGVLADRRMLILLDNAANEGQVRPLLPNGPGCGVLLTSRHRLSGLPAVHKLVDVLEPDQAVELLAKVAGPDRVAAEPEVAQAIVGLCGYLPLAVRIAGARLAARDWRLSRLVERLMDERYRLTELEVGDLEVRASFALSYDGRSEDERRAFRLLGLLDVRHFAPWVLAALQDSDVPEAERLIERLEAAQLLESVGEDATGQLRYRFHDLLRAFARERLRAEEPADEQAKAMRRAVGAYLACAEHAAGLLEPGDTLIIDQRPVPEWLPRDGVATTVRDPIWWFDAERVNLVALVTQTHDEGAGEMTWLLANTVPKFFDLGSHWRDWQVTHDLALAAAQKEKNLLAEAATLRNLAKLAHLRGRQDKAVTMFNQSLSMFRTLGHWRGEGYTLRNLGVLLDEQRRYDDAIDCFDLSLSIFRRLGSCELGEALSLQGLGDASRGKGRLDDAIESFHRSLALFQGLGHRLGEAEVLTDLAVAHQQQGRLDDAIGCYDRCLPILQQLGHRRLHAEVLRRLAELHQDMGHLSQAAGFLDRCLPILRELPDAAGEAQTHVRRGDILDAMGDREGARMAWRESLRISRERDVPEVPGLRDRLHDRDNGGPPPHANR